MPDIFATPGDDGENDATRDMVCLQSEWLVDAFVSGDIETFTRPIGGGEVAKLGSQKWEVDDPLLRFATGSLDPENWSLPDATPTHRIFVSEEQFYDWMRCLQRPEELTDEQIEKVGNPAYRVPSLQHQNEISASVIPTALDSSALTSDRLAGVGPVMLSIKQVSAKVGIGRSTIYGRMKNDTFPYPVPIGGRSLWREDEIDQWIQKQTDRR